MHFHAKQTHFHFNGSAPRLALKQRQTAKFSEIFGDALRWETDILFLLDINYCTWLLQVVLYRYFDFLEELLFNPLPLYPASVGVTGSQN